MSEFPLFDELISGLDPDDVPPEYIIMAVVTDFNGTEHMVYGDEINGVLRGPERARYRQAKVILDVKRIRTDVMEAVGETFEQLNDLLARAHENKNKDI